jgi:mRNA (guanine-N7-)-methyltransferase
MFSPMTLSASSESHPHAPPAEAHVSRDASTVAAHYNQHMGIGREDRQASQIFALRGFNNWVKSVLLSSAPRGGMCLDLCCGKAGDLQKWVSQRPSYIACVDNAFVSLVSGVSRFNSYLINEYQRALIRDARNARAAVAKVPHADFVWADTFRHRLVDHFEPAHRTGAHPQPLFDFASCQFALHYSWESEARARRALQNVGELLKEGEFFVATFPDKRVILDRLGRTGYCWQPEAPADEPVLASPTANLDGGLPPPTLRGPRPPALQNPFYMLAFDGFDRPPEQLAPYGIRYMFALADAIDPCPEYLVDLPTLQAVALEYGLVLEEEWNFAAFDQAFGASFGELKRRVRAPQTADIPPDEWDIITLYMAARFRKNTKLAVQQTGTTVNGVTPEDVAAGAIIGGGASFSQRLDSQPLTVFDIASLYSEADTDAAITTARELLLETAAEEDEPY